jgi:type IV pilus assembly protein PilN
MIRINLLATERKQKAVAPAASAGTLQIALILSLFAGGAVVVCALLWWMMSSRIEQLDKQIADERRRQQDLQAIQRQVDEFQKKKTTLENKVQVIEKLRLSQKSQVHMLDEVSKALPDFVWLTAFDESRGAITFRGQSNSLAAVADFMNALEGSGWFPSVELANASEQQSLVSFDLTGQFKDPEVAAQEASAGKGADRSRPGAR